MKNLHLFSSLIAASFSNKFLKKFMFGCFLFLFANTSIAQSLVGWTSQGFVKFDLNTKNFVVINNDVAAAYPSAEALAQTTTDNAGGRYFIRKSGDSLSMADTLYSMDIHNGNIVNYAIPKNKLWFPQYDNGKIYGISNDGFEVFDLLSQVYTVINSNAKMGNAAIWASKSSFDYTNAMYVLVKADQYPAIPDTILFINTFSGSVTSEYLTNNMMAGKYISSVGKILYPGGLTGFPLGIYSYDVQTGNISYITALPVPTVLYSGTMACEPNGYNYYINYPVNNAPDTLLVVNALNNSVTKVPLSTSFISFEYFSEGLGINEATTASFDLFPNPATTMLNISGLSDVQGVYQIYSLNGQLMQQGNIGTGINHIPLSPAPSGIYLISINTDKGSYSAQFVRQ